MNVQGPRFWHSQVKGHLRGPSGSSGSSCRVLEPLEGKGRRKSVNHETNTSAAGGGHFLRPQCCNRKGTWFSGGIHSVQQFSSVTSVWKRASLFPLSLLLMLWILGCSSATAPIKPMHLAWNMLSHSWYPVALISPQNDLFQILDIKRTY